MSGRPKGLVTALVTSTGGYVGVTDEIPKDTSPQAHAKNIKNQSNYYL